MKVVASGGQVQLAMTDNPTEKYCRPAADYLMRSVAEVYGAPALVNTEGRRIGHIIDDEEPMPYPGALEVHRLRQVFNLQYRWTMYAPSPPAYNGWWVCVGRTRSGAEIDPITGAVPTFAPPGNAAWPFGGLGSIYWFWEPDPEGYVQEEFADFTLWHDARYTAKAEGLTHFSLFYVYVPYEPVEEGPHAPMPMLALRWPEQEQGVDAAVVARRQLVARGWFVRAGFRGVGLGGAAWAGEWGLPPLVLSASQLSDGASSART